MWNQPAEAGKVYMGFAAVFDNASLGFKGLKDCIAVPVNAEDVFTIRSPFMDLLQLILHNKTCLVKSRF